MTRRVALSDVAEINPPMPRSVRARHVAEEVPFLAMAAVSEAGEATYSERRPIGNLLQGYTHFQRGDVLLAKITPCFENGKAVHLRDMPAEVGFGSTEFHVLRPGPDLDGRYLFHLVWSPTFRRAGQRYMTGTAGQKRIPGNFLESYRLCLPTLSEQRRIATLLDKTDAVRRKRRESLRLLDETLRSAYVSLVGHRNSDYTGWPQYELAELAADSESMRTGPFGSALRHSEFVDSGVAVLGIDNAVQNRFTWAERRFITLRKYEEFKRYTVRPGDVIITIMGTTGRSAVVPDDIPIAISTKHLAVITVDRSKVHPLFLSHAVHSDPTVLAQIAAANRGAIMTGLNLGLIKRLRLRLPPPPAQQLFVDLVRRVSDARDRVVLAGHEANQLFESLAQRALRGESEAAHTA